MEAIFGMTDDEAAELYGTQDTDTGLVYPSVTVNNWGPPRTRFDAGLIALAKLANNLRVYEVADNADAVGVMPGRVAFDGTGYAYAGGDPAVDALANNDTTYVWAYLSGGVVTIASALDATGWPAYQHVKLAEVTMTAGVISELVDRRGESLFSPRSAVTPLLAFGAWAIDGDGARTNGGGLVGDVTLTAAANAYAVVEDYDAGGSDYQLLATSDTGTGYGANWQLFPDTEAANDAAYFGAAVPFCELALDIGTAGVYSADALVWEYWNGTAWTALTVIDRTDTTAGDGKRSFQRDGAIHFVPPASWAATTVKTQSAYWIRARVTAANITTIPTMNTKNHDLVTPSDGFVCPWPGRITAIRAVDATTGTVHANPVKFLLVNFTTGATSGELTWAAAKRQDRWSALTLDAAAGDVLGVVVTSEDGTNEVVNGALELTITPRS